MRLAAFVALTCVVGAQAQIHPPFKRQWTAHVPEGIGGVSGIEQVVLTPDAVFYTEYKTYGRINRATGKVLWHKELSDDRTGPSIAFDGKVLYVWAGQSYSFRRNDTVTQGQLMAVDPAKGRTLWSIPAKGEATGLTAANGLMYWEQPPGTLAALDPRTRKARWTYRMTDKPSATRSGVSYTSLETVRGTLVVGLGAGDVVCLDARTGKRLWRTSLASEVYGFSSDATRVYGALRDRLVALDPKTGKPAWSIPTGTLTAGPTPVSGRLVGVTGRGVLVAFDAANGKTVWTHELRTTDETRIGPPLFERDRVLVAVDSTLHAFAPDGKELWECDLDHGYSVVRLAPAPLGILVVGSSAVMRFAMGTPEGLPTDAAARRAIADKLVAHIDKMDEDEHRTLEKLGDEAFDAILFALTRDAAVYDLAKSQNQSRLADKVSSRLYDESHEIGRLMRPARTGDILAVIGPPGSTPRESLLPVLAYKGDDRAVPVMLEEMRANPTGPALGFLARSEDPRAVDCLIDRLADPRAEPSVRNTAYTNLARTGGELGVKAVLAARDTGRTIPPIPEMLHLDTLPLEPGKRRGASMELLATKNDAARVVWGLFTAPLLGSSGDLWIARRDGNHWTDPFFTGVSVSSERFRATDADRKAAAKRRTELVEGGKWFAEFVGNAALRKDSDGDGWPDVVEKRLGTDPNKRDTDGDGLIDSEDRNPLAAPRALSEEEQVLAAAFEGRYRFVGLGRVPAVVTMPKGMKPIEFAGSDWVVLTFPEGAPKPPADALYGTGVCVISFLPPHYDLSGQESKMFDTDKRPLILWSPDHKKAKVAISTYYGGLNGTGYDMTVEKFGDDWVVIEAVEVWVS